MSLIIVKGIIVLYSNEGRIILDWLRVPDPRLILDGIRDFIEGEFQ